MRLPPIRQPNEKVTFQGVDIAVTDDLGVSLDPRDHAKPSCTTCWGKGAFYKSVPADAKALGLPDGDMSRNVSRTMTTCGCVERRYQRARAAVMTSVSSEQ